MRILVDLASPDSALNVTPSGQSGHLMSPHYKDQWDLYREGKFRIQWMDKEKIRSFKKLELVPA
jgi:penicillin amidase